MEAALAWIPYGRGESLFAATGERSDPDALTALLLQARRELSRSYPNIALEFPAGEFDQAIQAAGFQITPHVDLDAGNFVALFAY